MFLKFVPFHTLYFQLKLTLACDEKTPVYLVEHDAHDDFVSILTKYKDKLPNCALVDFAGTLDELTQYVEMGLYIVISCMYNYLIILFS